jgi:prepilin-type processing-associated H-X9-DG protein
MHSWRVLILPYLGELPLYEVYDFSEPWDGPNNSKVGRTRLDIFQCPSGGQGGGTMTNYVAVVGPDTAWPGQTSTSLEEDFGDGPQNTLSVVEMANSGIHWTEPRDLDVTKMPLRVNSKTGQGVSGRHTGGVNVAFADGSVRFLSDGLLPKMLHALLTRDGGEEVGALEY